MACIRSADDIERAMDKLLTDKGAFFCKPLDGECGAGVFRLIISDGNVELNGARKSKEDAKQELKARFSQNAYLVQTMVVQHPEVSGIYDKAVNTLRILTVFDKDARKAVPVAGEIRFGANGSVADNLAAGGVAVGVDLQTGELSEYGICKKGGSKRTLCHPDTLVPFAEVKLPFVQDAVDQTEKLHEKLSSIRIIGWDIAITEEGPVFIEGNDNPEISGLQTVNGGMKKNIRELLKTDF